MRAFTKHIPGPFADFAASQNSHCVYSAGYNLLAAAHERQGVLSVVDTAAVARADYCNAQLTAAGDELLDAEYAAACGNSSWPERMYWLSRNWRWLLSEAAVAIGALAVLSSPVWAGAGSKALIGWLLSFNWAAIGADFVHILDSITVR